MKSLFRFTIQALVRLALIGLAAGFVWVAVTGWLSQHMTGLASHTGVIGRAQARELLTRAVELQPSNGEAWWYLGNLELGDHNLDEAEHAINQALLTYTRHQAHRLHAQILWTKSLLDASVRFEALEAFDDALAINPQDTEALNNAANIALGNFEVERARRYMEQADHFDVDPTDPRAQNPESLVVRADLAIEDGDYLTARWLVEQVILLHPDYTRAAFRLAQIEYEQFHNPIRAYEILKSNFEPEIWVEYLDLMATLAVERADFDMLLQLRDAITLRREALGGGERELGPIFVRVVQGMIDESVTLTHINMQMTTLQTLVDHRGELAPEMPDFDQSFERLVRTATVNILRATDLDRLLTLQSLICDQIPHQRDAATLLARLRDITLNLHRLAITQRRDDFHQSSVRNLQRLAINGRDNAALVVDLMTTVLRETAQRTVALDNDGHILVLIRMVNQHLPQVPEGQDTLEVTLKYMINLLMDRAVASGDVRRCENLLQRLNPYNLSDQDFMPQLRARINQSIAELRGNQQ